VITAGLFGGNSLSSLAGGRAIRAEAVAASPLMVNGPIVSFVPSRATMLKVTLELLIL
jgi:hypothetical protein